MHVFARVNQMGKAKRVTVTINGALLANLEHARKLTGQNRSAFIRDAVATAVEQGHNQEEIERYLQGYRAMPEDAEEAWAFAAYTDGKTPL
jgi:metal-responsive CopG/Arc/MetJ family transcriptional regulator